MSGTDEYDPFNPDFPSNYVQAPKVQNDTDLTFE